MKKIITLSIILIILILLIVLISQNKTNTKKADIKNIKATTETFTITDNGTEIDVKLTNENETEATIKEIVATLYDSQNKKITSLNYTKETKIEKEKIIKITTKEKYSSTSKVKYKLTT